MCRYSPSLKILDTSLTLLDLDSLKEIRSGNVLVQRNAELCYVNHIDWRSLLAIRSQYSVSDNRNAALCGR